MRRPEWQAGLIVGGAALVGYLSTLAPTLTWAHHGADGGGLITAACVLGVPHPPGYPLYVLVGHLLCQMPVPLADVAARFNLLSAVCAAAAAAILAATLARSTGLAVGLVGGLVLAFGPALWSQAVITEVYALNALLVAILLSCLLARPKRAALDFVAGFVFGLGWTTHLTTALLFPLLVWGVMRAECRRQAVLQSAAGWLIGVGLYLVLPLLALRRPMINWGDPVTLESWWWVVSARLYRGFFFGLPLSGWPARMLDLLRLALQHLTLPGLALALVGAIRLARLDRALLVALLATAISVLLWALGYNTTDSHLLLIPLWMVTALLLGWGVSYLARLRPRWQSASWLALVIPFYMIVIGWSGASARGDRTAAEFGRQVMDQAPYEAIVYTSTDAHTFALWYYRHVRGLRPDVTVVDRDMLHEAWYRTMLLAQDPEWRDDLPAGRRAACTVSLAGELVCDD